VRFLILFVSAVILFQSCKKEQKEYTLTLNDISLPLPSKSGGKVLMDALNERRSTWDFSSEDITLQQLSDLLWAGCGINRPDQNKRTAPSARNAQEIEIYVAIPGGLYLYKPGSNILEQIHNRDIRRFCGTQDFVADAPVNLVFVADMLKLGKKEGDKISEADLLYSYANTGFISQNIYLYCASEDLGCVVRGLISRDNLAREMGLRPDQVIILSQTVGVPGIK